ncbi:MAG: tetratricopeptide repeat protein [Verrucomicrobia bacterium]|nr:tetratricopeptide repeat protein [Verrucomicrobiota bacterium]
MKFFVRLAALLLLSALPLVAQNLDEQYVKIYTLFQQGDFLRDARQSENALEKYREAETLLKQLQTSYPTWNENVVKYRLRYLADRIAELEPIVAAMPKKTATPTDTAPATPSLTQPVPAGTKDADLRGLIESLQAEVKRLEGGRTTLEAKLREALSAQPAAMDPRKLAAAEEQIRLLQKENEILKVTLRQERVRAADTVTRTEHEKLKTALTEANSKLAEQAEIINRLRLEKDALQARIQKMIEDSKENVLRAENDKLKLQIAEMTAKVEKADELGKQVTTAKSALEDAIKQMDRLAKDKSDLENKVRQMSATVATEPASGKINLAAPVNPAAADETKILTARVKSLETELGDAKKLVTQAGVTLEQLQGERNSLMAKVNNLEVAAKTTPPPAVIDPKNPNEQLARERITNQLSVLRARLEVLEARQIPYSADELALFKQPETIKPNNETNAVKKSARVLPGGAAPLAAMAEKAFNERKLDEAEGLYKQILKLDEKNVYTLANLAAIQSELGHLDDAEASLARGLAEVPQDSYSLTLMGIVKFRKGKFDDALDVLSKAAQVDPNNAEIQNYLGITLSQKGLRSPAETALRKAVQLAPGYGSAHHNLAVTYAMASPPSYELARWHYQKALDNGHPKNAELEKILSRSQQAQQVTPPAPTPAPAPAPAKPN